MDEKIYVLKIDGTPEEQEQIFREAQERLAEYGKHIEYVVLPDGVTPMDFYLKVRAIEMMEQWGLELIRTGVPKMLEETMEYVFGKK